jgi:surface protein
MFESCTSLRYVPLFDTSKATSFENMFAYCYSLATIPPFNTSNVTNLIAAFFFCWSIEELPWLDTSKVTNFGSGIRGCVKLKKLPNWDFSKSTNFSYSFGSLSNVIEVTNLDTSSSTDLFELFARCNTLQKVNTLNISKSTRFDSAFYECTSLQSIPNLIRDGNTVCSMTYMSWNNGQLSNVPNFNTNRISTWQEAFLNNFSITSVGFTFSYPIGQTWATAGVFNNTFSNCRSLRTIGLSDVSGISGSTYTNAYSGMFNTCLSLSEVGLSGISENFSIQNCSLGPTALNDLYTRLAVVGASGAGAKTITVSGNWGAASDNPAIAIAKGWSVSG